MLPGTITQGWPVKVFSFTGEWQEITTGGRRAAMRNTRARTGRENRAATTGIEGHLNV